MANVNVFISFAFSHNVNQGENVEFYRTKSLIIAP